MLQSKYPAAKTNTKLQTAPQSHSDRGVQVGLANSAKILGIIEAVGCFSSFSTGEPFSVSLPVGLPLLTKPSVSGCRGRHPVIWNYEVLFSGSFRVLRYIFAQLEEAGSFRAVKGGV